MASVCVCVHAVVCTFSVSLCNFSCKQAYISVQRECAPHSLCTLLLFKIMRLKPHFHFSTVNHVKFKRAHSHAYNELKYKSKHTFHGEKRTKVSDVVITDPMYMYVFYRNRIKFISFVDIVTVQAINSHCVCGVLFYPMRLFRYHTFSLMHVSCCTFSINFPPVAPSFLRMQFSLSHACCCCCACMK